jgi:hypothetical protein
VVVLAGTLGTLARAFPLLFAALAAALVALDGSAAFDAAVALVVAAVIEEEHKTPP